MIKFSCNTCKFPIICSDEHAGKSLKCPQCNNIIEIPSPSANFKAFVYDLATYFKDFLETDFHKRSIPKRNIKYKNSNNLLIGLSLKKYETFNSVVWKTIHKSFNTTISVDQGKYTTTIPSYLLDLIYKQVNIINEEHINNLISSSQTYISETVLKHKQKVDEALSSSIDGVSKLVREILVSPFLTHIEKPLMDLRSADIESIHSIEESLIDLIVEPLKDIISEAVNSLIVGDKIQIVDRLNESFNLNQIKNSFISFFNNYSINDLFLEIQELFDNKNILDKQDLYLDFCDIQFGNQLYPIFFIPIQIDKNEQSYRLTFNSSVYINKKTIDYILQEYNREKNREGSLKKIADRIIYLQEHKENFPSILNEIINEISDYFELSPQVDIQNSDIQSAKGLTISLSNSCYLSIFDKADYALINDYEEIIKLINSEDTILTEKFKKLINDFIIQAPYSLKQEIQKEWHDKTTEDKLVYSNPVSVNPEQRQIILALEKENCRYITVEGPPGTGKSHTITAILFNAILKKQSVLVLSDKEEALDVVENKITKAMNKVRVGYDFQNPILRVGKSGNTFRKILTTTSLNNIREHYRAEKHHYDNLDSNIDSIISSSNDNLQHIVKCYNNIKIADFQDLIYLETKSNNWEKYPIDFEETISYQGISSSIKDLRDAILKINRTLVDQKFSKTLIDLFHEFYRGSESPQEFKFFLDFLYITKKLKSDYESNLKSLKSFIEFSDGDLDFLRQSIKGCKSLRSVVFGFLFTGKKLFSLNNELNNYFKFRYPIDLKNDISILHDCLSIFSNAEALRKEKNNLSGFSFKSDFLCSIHKMLTDDNSILESLDLDSVSKWINEIESFIQKYPYISKRINLNTSILKTYYENKFTEIDESVFNDLITHIDLHQKLYKAFESLPRFDYIQNMANLGELLIHKITRIMDESLLNFYDSDRSGAETLEEIIRKKKRFSKKEFDKIKDLFPCILAGIRDYAEYIPLEADLFDLLIIDESSQISIAQAFPAILRAKKILVFGDKKQFGNVKSYMARSDFNKNYLDYLEDSFKYNFSNDPYQLKRLTKFDIKKSILEFFEFLSNFDIMLLKHFRGYRELISYSSKYFYDGNLQAVRIRGKSLNEVIKFSFIKHDGKIEPVQNTNIQEIEFIADDLVKLKNSENKVTVGIITPHINQQKLLSGFISKMPDRDYFYEKMKLKIMTFDTCQGEERDIVYYSMVANPISDRLWGIFIKDLSSIDLEEFGKIKTQRLNVGFSRAKECMHFILSKSTDMYTGAIGDALMHYSKVFNDEKKFSGSRDIDPTSPIEKKVLEWIKNTSFFQNHTESIDLYSQFPLGEYLKQLDRFYSHPAYRTDFLLIFTNKQRKQYNIIITYDGFNEHFKNHEKINQFNDEEYYTSDHIEKEKLLESYGYSFLRINRFNIGKDPVQTLDDRLKTLV